MKFVDQVSIHVTAGDGGAGSSHFRREKFVPRGGPDGGDGGKGGSVFAKATLSKRTLLDFQYHPEWKAERGGPGGTNQKTGKDGDDLYLEVPIGTEIYREEDGEQVFVADLTEDSAEILLAKGGRGGKGNTFFKSSTNQAPTHSQPGTEGQSGSFILSLKLIADIGLIGLPNAGKSTLLSSISDAKPKIGAYPFTTKEPGLGFVKGRGEQSCIVADIPGLIEGAHTGKGLGITFLKHIERTRVLAHLIDCSPLELSEDGAETIKREKEIVENELRRHSSELSQKPVIYVFTKADLLSSEWSLDDLRAIADIPSKTPISLISSATQFGIDECIINFFSILRQHGH